MSTRRASIVDAAARLIERRGYEGTSVEDVIRDAGLSGKSHFYHYFSSKEELGFNVLEHQFERFTARGLALLREPMIEPMDRLELFVETLVALQTRGRAGGGSASPFGALVAELADSHEGFRKRLAVVFERWTEELEQLFREVAPRLRNGTQATRLARFVIAALEGGMMLSRVTRDGTVLRDVGEDVLRHVRSQLEGERA